MQPLALRVSAASDSPVNSGCGAGAKYAVKGNRPTTNAGSFAAATSTSNQGLTPVHLPAQRKRFSLNKGCLGAVYEVRMAGVEGVFRASGNILSVRNG